MPAEYLELDIAQHVLDLCTTQEELQRVGQELLLYQERDLFNLLRYLKYFVDTMRKNGVVWGLGRGSSVASYILYLLGVHKINSLYYDLPIDNLPKGLKNLKLGTSFKQPLNNLPTEADASFDTKHYPLFLV
jgi:hypothetical protein